MRRSRGRFWITGASFGQSQPVACPGSYKCGSDASEAPLVNVRPKVAPAMNDRASRRPRFPRRVNRDQLAASSSMRRWTRASISSRMRRTVSTSLPGVFERPVLVSLAGIDRAGVAAAHRDHDIGGAHDLIGERLRELLAHVDAELVHRLDDRGVDHVARGRCRPSGRGRVPAERSSRGPQPSGCDRRCGRRRTAPRVLPSSSSPPPGREHEAARGQTGVRAPGTNTLMRELPSRSSDSAM